MATAAAAVAARARREVETYFSDHEAYGPEHAIDFEPTMSIQRRYLEQLIGQGVVHEAEPGRYWFDQAAFEEKKRERFAWTMRILAVAGFVFLVVLGVQFAMQHR